MLPVPALLVARPLHAAAVAGDAPPAKPSSRSRAGERLRRADADQDGYLSRAEAQQSAPRLAENFDAIDANHDGRLSPQEIRNYARSRGAVRAGARGQAAGVGSARIDARFAAADSDGDGQLSRAEAAALPRVARKFERMDADGDGRLSADEFRAWLARRKAARAAKS